MSRGELREHLGYVSDQIKTAAYQQALSAVITPTSVVLDLGSGTGLLGMLACQAGARRVYAVDDGPILGAAAATAQRNGFAHRIVNIRGMSTEIDLPERVDVVISDQIGGIAQDAGVFRFHADARARLCAPGAVFIPASFQLRMAPVGAAVLSTHIYGWSKPAAALDFSEFAQLATNSVHHYEGSPRWLLGHPEQFAVVRSDVDKPLTGSAISQVTRAGTMHAVRGSFRAELAPEVWLTNEPGQPDSFSRWQNYYPLDAAVRIRPGDTVEFRIDIRPKVDVTTWWITVRRASRVVHQCQRSTALGTFLDADDLQSLDRAFVPAPSPALSQLVDAMDGATTVSALERLAIDSGVARSGEGARDAVQQLLALARGAHVTRHSER